MADQKHGAVELGQELFEQLQGFDVEVVGRFIEHQHVGRARKQPRQQQPVALATRQGADGRTGARRGKQKIAQVAAHVDAARADLDPLAARADEVFERGVEVERVAHLVEVGHLDPAAAAHLAAVGGELAQNQLEQGGFAGAVGADQPHFVAAQHGGGKVVDDAAALGAIAKVFAHALELGHQAATARPAVHIQPHLPDGGAALGVLGAQHLQAFDARLGAGAPRLDAFADPLLLLRQQLVGAGVEQRLLCQALRFEALKGAVGAVVAVQQAAVELHRARADAVQKVAVVADEQQGATKIAQQLGQPADGVEVEVVGGFVEQQQIGQRHQRLRQRHALAHATREAADALIGLQAEPAKGLGYALLPVPAIQGFDFGLQRVEVAAALVRQVALQQLLHALQAHAHGLEHAGLGVELGLLRHVGHAQPVLALYLAVVGALEAGDDFEQRRFAAAVAPHQSDALAGLERKIDPVEQGQVAVGEAEAVEGDPGHGAVGLREAWSGGLEGNSLPPLSGGAGGGCRGSAGGGA